MENFYIVITGDELNEPYEFIELDFPITEDAICLAALNYSRGDNSNAIGNDIYHFGENKFIKILRLEKDQCPSWNFLWKAKLRRSIEDLFCESDSKMRIRTEKILKDLTTDVTKDFILGGFGMNIPGPSILVRYDIDVNHRTLPEIALNIKNEDPIIEAEMIREAADQGKSSKPIFISHASKDKVIVEQFVDEFLERGLGIDAHADVYYTSSPVTGIRAGVDWREDIRKGVIEAKVVFCFISQNYTASQYCIAELGAAWAFEKTIIPIILPPRAELKGHELYAVLQMIDGNERIALNRLKDDLINVHKIGKRIDSSAKWEKALGKYLEAVATTEAGIGEARKK